MSECPHGLDARQCSECCDAPAELRPAPEHEGKPLHWLSEDGVSTVALWDRNCETWSVIGSDDEYSPGEMCGCYRYLGPAEWRADDQAERVAALEAENADLARKLADAESELAWQIVGANSVAEFVLKNDNKRIVELEAEVAALTEMLRTLFKSAAATPVVSPETPPDQFPPNALKWSV